MTVRRDSFGKGHNYYLALASEFAAPALRLAARMRAGAPTPRAFWRKGLIIGHSHIGDVLYRTPSLPFLRIALPKCEWHYLTAPVAAAVLQGNPNIDRVLPLLAGDDSWNLRPGGFELLRSERYDVALCTNSLRHHPDLLLSTALAIPNRVAYSHKGLSGLITHPVAIEYPSPFPMYFRAMVASLGEAAGDWPAVPQVHIDEADARLAEECWSRLDAAGRPVIACCPTTRQPDGGWPRRLFMQSLQLAYADTECVVALCGSASDEPILRSLADESTLNCRVLAGSLPLRAFASFLGRCQLVFAQDSAPRHLGNAVRVPVAFFRNLAASRVESGTYCEGERDLAPLNVEVAGPAEREATYQAVTPESIASLLVAAQTSPSA